MDPRGTVGFTQNMNALGLVVSKKKICLCFSHCKPMGDNDPWGRAIFDPRGTVGRIYIENHVTRLHCYTQNRKALCLVVSEKKIFYVFPVYGS